MIYGRRLVFGKHNSRPKFRTCTVFAKFAQILVQIWLSECHFFLLMHFASLASLASLGSLESLGSLACLTNVHL